MTTIGLPQIAEIVWQTTTAWRVVTCHEGRRCPTQRVPYGNDDPCAVLVAEECRRVGCLDLIHDLWVYVNEALGQDSVQQRLAQVSNLGGYLRRMVTTRLADIQRTERVKRGFPAKPNRGDGAPGRVNAVLLAEGGRRGEWLVQLFQILRSCPFGSNHVPGHWPISGLMQEHATTHGEMIAEEQVLCDITQVLQTARRVLGNTWVHDNLILPMRGNGPAEVVEENSATTAPPSIDHAQVAMLLDTYERLCRSGRPTESALLEAIKETCGIEIQATREIREALAEFRQAG